MSMSSEKTITLHVNVPKSLVEVFDKMYPASRRRFISRAMLLATQHREVFDKIFFSDIITNNGESCFNL